MRILQKPADLRAALDEARSRGRTIGLVPTMGALHQGHLTLCRASVGENDVSVVSVFVNPLQFGVGEDFGRYPRNLDADAALLEQEGVHFLFAPEPAAMYPPGFQTSVDVAELSGVLEGEVRPGHFRGVATVVLKLFNAAGPCRAYFGEKDYQQLQLVKRMAADLDVPVTICSVPTVREADGLAMSSRNAYLSREERAAAPAIYQALLAARDSALQGEIDANRIIHVALDRLAAEPLLHLDYLSLVDPSTLAPINHLVSEARILAAVRLGSTRLIDNVAICPTERAR